MLDEKHEMLIDVLGYTPMKQSEIKTELMMKGLRITERRIRGLIKDINEEYIKGGIDYVVISNNQGTYKSDAAKDILEYNEHKKSHALSELYMSYNMNKRLANQDNLTFDEYLKEVTENEQ